MKHCTKRTETYTNRRCAHLLSGVLRPCLSVTRNISCVWQTLHALMNLRIKTALHCMFLVKQSLCFTNSFPSMSVTMHRPCMTSYKSVNPTTKHLSLVRHGHLRCLPSLPDTSTEGTEFYAMSAIQMHSDMISTCLNLDTQN